MRTRKLGFTDLELTVVGLGAWAIGGSGWKFAWGAQDDNQSIAAIRRAVKLGINWIDTAAVYGIGHSEKVVGRALKDIGTEVLVATKCGRREDSQGELYGDLRPKSVRQECEASLKRLQVERIDLYQIHWPIPDEQIEDAWGEISKLVGEGKVRYAGVSNFSVEQMKRLLPIHPIASMQPPYSMLRPEIESAFDFCRLQGIGVVAYSPMECGLLTGAFDRQRISSLPSDDWRRKNPRFCNPDVTANLALVEQLETIARKIGITRAQFAIAWVLRRDEVTAAIVGARRPSQIEETAPAADVLLSRKILDEVDELLAARKERLGRTA
ncbi:MAG TPA: aldo/keto reductase [Acidobacteriota bacterium]|jgi:aryl-alcohol dehydrogenase-like predicted oxidoreductase